MVFYALGFALVTSTYVIIAKKVMKQLDMLFTISFGWIFFKEKNIKDKFVGGLIMLIGSALILM